MTLTAIVFNYNYKRFLPDVLTSLVRQTRRPDRIVVSDDASPRDSLAELQAAVGQFDGVELIRNPVNLNNIEHYRARVAEVQTDAYLLMSADDYLVDDRFCEQALTVLRDNPKVVAVWGWHVAVDPLGREQMVRSYPPDREMTLLPGEQLRARLAFDNVVPAVCCVVRNSLHQHIGAYPVLNRHCGDWQQFYLFTYHGDFMQLERKVCHYRLHGANMSTSYEADAKTGALIAQGYQQLLDRPEITAEDRQRLLAGMCRSAIRHTPFRQMHRPLVQYGASHKVWLALAETVSERLARRASDLRIRLHNQQLKT